MMAPFITNDLNPTPLKTGGDDLFEPAVMRGAGVVLQNTKKLNMAWVIGTDEEKRITSLLFIGKIDDGVWLLELMNF